MSGLVLAAAAVPLLYLGYRLLQIICLRRKVLSLGLPMFRGLPLLGNSLELVKKTPGIPPLVYTFQTICGLRVALREHDMFVFNNGPFCYVVLTKPEHVEVLLTDQREINKSDDYKYLLPLFGFGLIVRSGKDWMDHRKKLNPAFHYHILEEAQRVSYEYSQQLVEKLQLEVGKTSTNLGKHLHGCAFDIIARMALGVDITKQRDTAVAYVSALETVSYCVVQRNFSPWLWPDILFRLSSLGRKMSKSLEVIRSFNMKVIQERSTYLNERKEEILDSLQANEENRTVKRTLLDLMLVHNMRHESGQFSHQEIADEVNTFAAAGHRTVGVSMDWTLYLLGLHSDIQDKVYDELEDIFGDDIRRQITTYDIRKMNYLERVIKESQRLYPPVPLIIRKMSKSIKIGDRNIPKGAAVMVPIHAVHREARNFTDPEIFDPDRFLRTIESHSYVPFSSGPRNCIGQRLAMLEMKTVLANVLRNFRVSSLDPRDKVLCCGTTVCFPHAPIRNKLESRLKTPRKFPGK